MKIQIAGVKIELIDVDDYTKRLSQDYLIESDDVDMKIAISNQDLAQTLEEIEGYEYDVTTVKSFAFLEKIDMEMLAYDGFYLHAATIAVDDYAYAFTAKSGTGKSTHIQLWKDYFKDRAYVVNGDRPFLRRIDGVLYACGSPWCGKEGWNTNIMVPLKALCFLERGESNHIERIPDSQVVECIFRQLRLPSDPIKMNRLLELLDWIIKNIPCYRLHCNMELTAAKVAYEGMQEE